MTSPRFESNSTARRLDRGASKHTQEPYLHLLHIVQRQISTDRRQRRAHSPQGGLCFRSDLRCLLVDVCYCLSRFLGAHCCHCLGAVELPLRVGGRKSPEHGGVSSSSSSLSSSCARSPPDSTPTQTPLGDWMHNGFPSICFGESGSGPHV